MTDRSFWIRVALLVWLPASAGAVDVNTLRASGRCDRYTVKDCGPLGELVAAPAEATRLALSVLGDDDATVRTAARRLLGLAELGDVAGRAAALTKAIESLPDERRGDALLALGELAQPESESLLVGIAGDEKADARNRIYAAAALAKYPSDAARAALETALFSDTPRLQETAAVALAKTLPASGDALVKRALAEMTPGYVRTAAARSLIQGKDPRALPVLGLLLAVPNAPVRQAAAEGLAALGDKRAVPVLLVALGDPEAGPAAARALGLLGDARAVDALATAIAPSAPHPFVLAALDALAELRGASAIAQIAPWLQEPDLTVAKAAADCLGRIGAIEALPHLDAVGDRGDAGFAKALAFARSACKGGLDAEAPTPPPEPGAPPAGAAPEDPAPAAPPSADGAAAPTEKP